MFPVFLLWMPCFENQHICHRVALTFLLQFSLSAVKSLCPMFLRICQGHSNISFRHNFKRLLAFFDLTYETKSVLSVEDVCDGIPDTIVTARSMPYQGLNSAPKMGQPSKSVFLFPICWPCFCFQRSNTKYWAKDKLQTWKLKFDVSKSCIGGKSIPNIIWPKKSQPWASQ